VDLPEAVRLLALHPFRELPIPPDVEPIETGGVLLLINPFPNAQIVEPLDITPAAVAATVAETRTIARERGKTILAWWVAPEHDGLTDALESAGLVNEDTPGYESVENAMTLLEPPAGEGGDGVAVKETETYEEFVASLDVLMDAFAVPGPMRAEAIQGFPQRWESYCRPDNPGRQYIALIDGRVVGTAGAGLGGVGVNLFGGSVVEDARGRGVYRALTVARWEVAVARGTPALTVQAGRMSKPIVEKLGFRDVAGVRVYVDNLAP
jgi:GNAT superfamily N-acetyltransferase